MSVIHLYRYFKYVHIYFLYFPFGEASLLQFLAFVDSYTYYVYKYVHVAGKKEAPPPTNVFSSSKSPRVRSESIKKRIDATLDSAGGDNAKVVKTS